MISEREASGGKREAVLHINRVEGIEKLGYAAVFCRALLIPSDPSISQQKFKTSVSKNGIWEQDFSFEYANSNDEIIIEVVEQKWFGREQLIGAATPTISDLLHKKHVNLSNSSGQVYVKLLDNNMKPMSSSKRLSGKKRMKREMKSSSGELDMATFFQKKIEVHKTMIESLGAAPPDLLSASYDEEEFKRELLRMEDSLKDIGGGSDSFKNILESLQPADYSQIEAELNQFNTYHQETSAQTVPTVDITLLDSVQHPSSVDLEVLNEKVKLLRDELENERAYVEVLKKRNMELESEIKRKDEEIISLKEKDSAREKMLWENLSRIDSFDEKIRSMESEREFLRACEQRLLAQEKVLQQREELLQKSIQEMEAHRAMVGNGKDQNSISPRGGSNSMDWMAPVGFLEEKLSFLSSRLSKLDQLDEVMSRLESMAAKGGTIQVGESSNRKRTAADIKAEMEELQKIICDDNAPAKEREAANLKIDRLFTELTSTDEYKAEVKRAQEEKIKLNEPLNKEALQSMLQKLANIANDDQLLARRRQYPALTLIGMDPHTILGKHQNDFNQFLLGDLTLEEVRAIRASMPVFRRDQKKQHEFVESLDNKIEQLAKNPAQAPKPKRVFAVSKVAAKTRPHSMCVGGGMANLAAELMSKRRTAAE